MLDEKLLALKLSIEMHGIDIAADTFLLDRLPHLFREDWHLYRQWKRKLASLIQVDPRNISVVGSACTGFSLNPLKNFKNFDGNSDVDVAIVSEHHFSISWRALRSTNLSAVGDHKMRSAIGDHRSRYIYWGCIAADRILGLLPFKREWTEAMYAMAGEKPTEEREINFRIYRDYDALRAYHMNGMENLKSKILEN
ncbi:hypothetical protein CO670_26825 [Rhizobium sp. J15]|uniref:hypothetical protein n=1 Tax=Rhizobium sp. J15 TaxID=2035450 RepID=UPI000BE8881A|nr:hypothetical protein [Rhizobium sp. J15]PDT13750.1 hypothetical protein CO670_26825 [Rhizobium sp. J15]